jgi:hypothetical protein
MQSVVNHFVEIFGLGTATNKKHMPGFGFQPIGHPAVSRHPVADSPPA